MPDVTTEWLRLESGERFLSICRNEIPIFLPNQWLTEVFRGSPSPKTERTYAERLVIFFRWLSFQGLKLEDVTERDLFAFRSALDLEPDQEGYLFVKDHIADSTKRLILTCTLLFLRWAAGPDDEAPILGARSGRRSRGMLQGIVPAGIMRARSKLLKRKKKRLPEHLNESEVQVIRDWIDENWLDDPEIRSRNRAVFEVLYDTGIRLGELLSARCDCFDDNNRTLLIKVDEEEYRKARMTGKPAALQKTGERMVVMGPESVKWVTDYITFHRPTEALERGQGRLFCTHRPRKYRGQPLTARAVRYFFDLMNRPSSSGGCGIPHTVHPHTMRHSTATRLYRLGVETHAIQEQLGHADPQTTSGYTHITPELHRQMLDRARSRNTEKD